MQPIKLLSLGMLLVLSTGMALSQKPKDPFAARPAHSGVKTKSPYLSHHRGSSSTIPTAANSNKGPAAELSKIEQMSVHGSSSTTSKVPRSKILGLPKAGAVKGDRSAAINFNGKSAPRSAVVTRSGAAKSGARAPQAPKMH